MNQYFQTSILFNRSSLIYNTSARNERHKCDTSATQVRHEQHECDTSATRVLQERHECHTSENCKSQSILSHSYIYHIASERLQGVEQFYSKYFLWKCLIPMPECVWKVHHKNWTLVKAISKSYTLDCSCKFPCTFPHSYA